MCNNSSIYTYSALTERLSITYTLAVLHDATSNRALPPEVSVEVLIEVVTQALAGSSQYGVRGLRRAFKCKY
jgi:hypothetical protein